MSAENICLDCYRCKRTTPDDDAYIIGYCEWDGKVPAWLKSLMEDTNSPFTPKRDIYSSPFRAISHCDTFLPLKRT
jgi:hypothetical protein